MTDEALEIRLLGPFEVFVGRASADVGGSKRQALLAMLALRAGRVADVDSLVDGLWGEQLPAAPRNALHHHVARLRAALGEEAILGSADGYALRDARVDAARFEELLAETRSALREGDLGAASDAAASALALWRGSALQGLTGTAWFNAEARRLETLRVDALEEEFEIRLALGEHRELAPALRSSLADNPFRERLWGQLMLALYRGGRQADALETFQEARRVLGDELGLEPGPELRRLQEAILAQDPTLAAIPADRRRRGNLPAASTSFVGRDDELGRVAALLHEHRLVTLNGPPGVGKSRLAVETARSIADDFPDGVWIVDFARTAEPGDAVRLVAQSVDVRGADPPLTRVTSRLRHARALVLLDACEHVLEEAARIATTLLAECAGVKVLATTREALHLASEVRFAVAPLGSGAVDLFLARAKAARPGFEPGADEIALAAEIVRRVDGLPLGIELAAARVHVLALAELVSILERRADLVRDGPASDSAGTALRELVAWSYDLLHADEKTLMQHVAVHRGGASLESLVALTAPHGLSHATVAYLVSALVDKSIVSASFAAGAARYDMLDTVREYALDCLAETEELAAAQAAHAGYFATMAESAQIELRRAEWLQWLERLELEHDNLWAALAYARNASDASLAARLGAGLGWYFAIAERVAEGRAFTEAALEAAADAPLPLRVELLAYAGYLAAEEDELEAAIEAGEQGLALAATASDSFRENGLVRLALAFAYNRAGAYERTVELTSEARRCFDRVGDRWGAGLSGLIGALAALSSGDIPTADALSADAVRLNDDYDVGAVPAALLEAVLAERRGDLDAAAVAYGRALERSERARFAGHAAFALSGLGALAFARGELREAEELQRRAIATAEADEATWAVAHARVQLARVAAASGDADTAERLHREVVEWSRTARPRQAREGVFVALAGSPALAAEHGLSELGATALS